MHCNQLSLEMGRKLSHLKAVGLQHGLNLVAVGAALGGSLQIEQSTVPGRNLYSLVAQPRSPTRNLIESVKRCCISCKLRKENGWSFDCSHGESPLLVNTRLRDIG